MSLSRKTLFSLVILLVKLGATAFAFWLILRSIDLEAAWGVMRSASVGDLSLAFALLFAQVAVNGVRWSLIASYSGIHLHPAEGIFRLWESAFFGQLTPSGVGGDAWRIYALRSYGAELGPAMNVVVIDRLIGMAMLVLIVMGAFGAELLLGDTLDTTEVLVGGGLAFCMIIGVLGLLALKRLPENVGRMGRFNVVALARTVSVQFGEALRKPGLVISAMILSAIGHVFCALACWTLARAVGFDPGPLLFLAVVPLALLISMVPITVAGWGLREGVLAAGLVRLGANLETAAAVSLLFGCGIAALGVTGGIRLWLVRRAAPSRQELAAKESNSSEGRAL